MKIGELARRTGVPPRMIRYYEQQRLLASERSPNGYRAYREQDVARLQRVRSLVRSGVPTRLIGSILDMEGGADRWTQRCTTALADELADELRGIEERIACLELSRATIAGYLRSAGHGRLVDDATAS